MMDVSQLVAGADAPVDKKRPGRKPKAATEKAPAKPKRKYTRRAKVQPTTERAFAIFLGEDGLQLAPAGGGDPVNLTFADALAIAAFVERHRAALEP